MKKLLMLALCLVAGVLFAADIEYYVDAKNGRDDADGLTSANAVQSLAKVCELIAAQDSKATLTTVNVAPGNYGEDKGTEESLTWTGSKGGSHNYRLVIGDAAAKRRVLFKATAGKATTHIVGKKGTGNTYGQGTGAIGGVHGNNSAYIAFVGFTFRDCYAGTVSTDNVDRGGAATTVTLVDCVVSNCVATRGGAVQQCESYRCRFTRNQASNPLNGAASNAGTLVCCLVDHNTGTPIAYPSKVIGCTVVDNKNDNKYAFAAVSNKGNEICNTLVLRNVGSNLNKIADGTDLAFKACVSDGKKTYWSGDNGERVTIDGDCKFEVKGQQFYDAENEDYRLLNSSAAVGAAKTAYYTALVPAFVGDQTVRDYAGNPIDLTKEVAQAGCLQEVVEPCLYVKQNGGDDANDGLHPETAKATINAALAIARVGDTIKVYPGEYGEAEGKHYQTVAFVQKPTDGFAIPSRIVIPAGVTVEAVEGPSVTSIVGAADPDDEPAEEGAFPPHAGCGSKAVRCVMLNVDSKLIGFTVRGGRTNYAEGDYTDDTICGGTFGNSNVRCIVQDCVLTDLSGARGAAAESVTLIRCRIEDNYGPVRKVMRSCRFIGCYINNNYGGSVEHVSLLDSTTIGANSPRFDMPTRQCAGLAYPSIGGRFVNSIILVNVEENKAPKSYCYAVTNCVTLASNRDKLVEVADAAAIANVTFLSDAAAAGLDECGRPVPGTAPATIVDAAMTEPEEIANDALLGDKDLTGLPRVMNGTRDVGALEGNWMPKYSQDIGRRAVVTAVSPDVVEAGGKVTIPAGASITFNLENTTNQTVPYALAVTVPAGGMLSVTMDGAAVTVTDPANIRLEVANGTHSVVVSLAGTGSAVIQSLRNQSGLVLFLR